MSSTQVKYCFLLVLFTGCLLTCGPGCSDDNRDYHYKQLAKVYSPDRTKYFTITEYGTDTASAFTQVLLNFEHTGSGVYSTTGIDRGIKAYWKGNAVLVVETFKHYQADQQWPKVQSFNDIVRIEYIEK